VEVPDDAEGADAHGSFLQSPLSLNESMWIEHRDGCGRRDASILERVPFDEQGTA
jgi:hypothetical protein